MKTCTVHIQQAQLIREPPRWLFAKGRSRAAARDRRHSLAPNCMAWAHSTWKHLEPLAICERIKDDQSIGSGVVVSARTCHVLSLAPRHLMDSDPGWSVCGIALQVVAPSQTEGALKAAHATWSPSRNAWNSTLDIFRCLLSQNHPDVPGPTCTADLA